MLIEEIFLKVQKQLDANLEFSIKRQNKIGQILILMNAYKERSNHLDKNLIEEVLYNLYASIHLSLTGLYRQSFLSSRCSLELGISLIQFRDDNLSFLYWKANKIDISWMNFFDQDKGVLSKKYLDLFLENGNFSELINLASRTYRECSEYVHGKYQYIKETFDSRVSFNEDCMNKALEINLDILRILNTVLLIRFGNKNDSHFEIYESLKKELSL